MGVKIIIIKRGKNAVFLIKKILTKKREINSVFFNNIIIIIIKRGKALFFFVKKYI